jgi:hypothetical protein
MDAITAKGYRDKAHAKADLDTAIGILYTIRMHTSFDSLPEGIPDKLALAERLLVRVQEWIKQK